MPWGSHARCQGRGRHRRRPLHPPLNALTRHTEPGCSLTQPLSSEQNLEPHRKRQQILYAGSGQWQNRFVVRCFPNVSTFQVVRRSAARPRPRCTNPQKAAAFLSGLCRKCEKKSTLERTSFVSKKKKSKTNNKHSILSRFFYFREKVMDIRVQSRLNSQSVALSRDTSLGNRHWTALNARSVAIDTNDSHSDPDPTGMRVALRLAKHSDRALLPPGGRSGRGERERPVPIGQRREWAGPKEEPPTPFRFTMDHRADRLRWFLFFYRRKEIGSVSLSETFL